MERRPGRKLEFTKCLVEPGEAVTFRRKLLVIFALTVFISVTTVAVIVSVLARRAFEKSDDERTAALVAQFQHEFARRGEEITARVAAIAAGDAATRIPYAFSRGDKD